MLYVYAALTPYNLLILFYAQRIPYDSISMIVVNGAVLAVNVPLYKKNLP